MWFVFPQVAGLGLSSMSKRYAISSLDEARRYLENPVLGPRLEECARVLIALDDKNVECPRFRGHLSVEPVLSGLAGRIAHHIHDDLSQAVSAGVSA